MRTNVTEELMLKREEKSTKRKDWEESLRRSKDYNLRTKASVNKKCREHEEVFG
jgi:hypothetical protein